MQCKLNMVSLQNLSSENSFMPGPLPKVYHVFSFQQCNRTKQFYSFLPASSLHQVSPADHRMATLTKKKSIQAQLQQLIAGRSHNLTAIIFPITAFWVTLLQLCFKYLRGNQLQQRGCNLCRAYRNMRSSA